MTAVATPAALRDHAKLIIHDNGGVLSIAAFFVVMTVTFSLITDTFLTQINLLNILRQIAPLMIVAVSMTFVITTAGIDLSVGSVLALVNALAAISLQAGLYWPLVVMLMLGVGIVIGLFQGFFIAYEGIPAFIVTLAGLSSIRGTALLLTKGYSIPIDPQSPFNAIGRGWIFGLPMPAIIAIVVLALGFLVFNETTFGRYVTGVGANAEAVRRAGVDTKKITLAVYALSGLARGNGGNHHRRPPGKRVVKRRRRLRTRCHRGSRAGRNEPVRWPRHDAWHDARGANCRGDRQRPDPLSYVAVHNADRRGVHHSHRGLAQLPPVPDGSTDWLKKGGEQHGEAGDRRAFGIGADGAGPHSCRGDGRHAHARACSARRLELVEASVLRLGDRHRRKAARHFADRRFADEPISQSRQLVGCSMSKPRSKSSIISSSMGERPSSIRPISELAEIRQRCKGSADEPDLTSSWAPASISNRRIPLM